jgi:hypothetical protein
MVRDSRPRSRAIEVSEGGENNRRAYLYRRDGREVNFGLNFHVIPY